jgi:hypothetical protein
MPYELPAPDFDALEHARNKILRANQFQELVIGQFIAAYEDFWGVDPNGGSRYTVEQMQAVLDDMPMATAMDILTDALGFKTYLETAYPGQLPEKYHESAWAYTADQNGITLTELRPAWALT